MTARNGDAAVAPHDIEAERSTLGAILIDPSLLDVATATVAADDFFREGHRRIFRAMARLRRSGTAIDLLTLRNELHQAGDLDEAGGPAYVSSLTDGVPRSVNIAHYAGLVSDRARDRRALDRLRLASDAVRAGNLAQAHDAICAIDLGRAATQAAGGFIAAADVMAAPRPPEVVEGIAWAGCITILASESGTGKTFLLLDLASAVADGLTWHGRTWQAGTVAYISFEGDALGVRLRAIRDTQGRRLDNLHVLHAREPLSPRVGRDGIEDASLGELAAATDLNALVVRLAGEGRPPVRLLIIDTIRASLAGSEDSSEHTSAYLRAVRRIVAQVPQAGIILAHHAGWQDGDTARKRERGSSAWRGNCDATLYLEAGDYDRESGEARLTLRALKTRDTERPAPLYLLRRRVELPELAGDDLRRGPVTSCVIERDGRTREDREAEAAAAEATKAAELDRRVLATIRDRSELATSQDRLRAAVGAKRDDVVTSIARLIQQGAITPPERQRQPYELTDLGHRQLTTEVSQ